jgi:hypothetical protein
MDIQQRNEIQKGKEGSEGGWMSKQVGGQRELAAETVLRPRDG